MAKNESKPATETKPTEAPTTPPPESEIYLRQLEAQIKQLEATNATLAAEKRELEVQLDKLVREKLRTSELAAPVVAADRRDNRCVDRHVTACDCTGAMRGPIG